MPENIKIIIIDAEVGRIYHHWYYVSVKLSWLIAEYGKFAIIDGILVNKNSIFTKSIQLYITVSSPGLFLHLTAHFSLTSTTQRTRFKADLASWATIAGYEPELTNLRIRWFIAACFLSCFPLLQGGTTSQRSYHSRIIPGLWNTLPLTSTHPLWAALETPTWIWWMKLLVGGPITLLTLS